MISKSLAHSVLILLLITTGGFLNSISGQEESPLGVFPASSYTPTDLPLSATPSHTPTPSHTLTPTPPPPTQTPTLRPTDTPIQTMLLFGVYDTDTNGDNTINNEDNAIIYLRDMQTGLDTALTDAGVHSYDPALSPDGRFLAYVQEGVIFVLNRGTGRRTILADGSEPAWSPDGQQITYTTQGGNPNIKLINADGSGSHALTNAGINEANWLSKWSPDGNSIYFISRRVDTTADGVVVGCDRSSIYKMLLSTLNPERITSTSHNYSLFQLSPDGRLMTLTESWEYTPSADGRRCGWNDENEVQIMTLGDGLIYSILARPNFTRISTFSPDGQKLLLLKAASDENDDGVITMADARLLTVYDLSTGQIQYLSAEHNQMFDLSWVRVP